MRKSKYIFITLFLSVLCLLAVAFGCSQNSSPPPSIYSIGGNITKNGASNVWAYLAKDVNTNIIASKEVTGTSYVFDNLVSGTYFIYAVSIVPPLYFGTYGWAGPPLSPTFVAINIGPGNHGVSFEMYSYDWPTGLSQ